MTDETTTAAETTAESDVTATASAAETTVETSPAAASSPQKIYVGPKLRQPYPVKPLTIFRGTLPVPLAAAVAADADLAACFVAVSEYGAAKSRLKNSATALARSVAAVKARYGK